MMAPSPPPPRGAEAAVHLLLISHVSSRVGTEGAVPQDRAGQVLRLRRCCRSAMAIYGNPCSVQCSRQRPLLVFSKPSTTGPGSGCCRSLQMSWRSSLQAVAGTGQGGVQGRAPAQLKMHDKCLKPECSLQNPGKHSGACMLPHASLMPLTALLCCRDPAVGIGPESSERQLCTAQLHPGDERERTVRRVQVSGRQLAWRPETRAPHA